MEAFKILAVFLAAILAGMALLLLYELLLSPVRPGKGERVELRVYISGSAPGLENTLRGLLWLRSSGRTRADIVIVDTGADAETRKTARIICENNGGVRLLSAREAER